MSASDDRVLSTRAKAVAAGVVFLLVVVGIAALFGWVTVGEGHVGVEKERGAATGHVYDPGWAWQNPITQSYVEIETRPNTVDMNGRDNNSVYVITADGQDVWVDLTIRYRVSADEAVTFYSEYASHAQARERVIEPTVRSDVRDEASDISAREIITQSGRQSLEETAHEALVTNFEGTGLELEAVQVRGIELHDQFAEELEQIEIEQNRAEQRLIEANATAEAERVEAQGTADAYETRSEAIDDNVLAEAYMDALDRGDVIVVPADGDGMPVIVDGTDSMNATDGGGDDE